MSIAVLIGVHDGIVLAADSASTLTISVAPGLAGVGNVYDNANKIFNLYKGKPIGCVAFGMGSIGSSSIGTLIKDLRVILMTKADEAKALGFDPKSYTVEGVANTLGTFIGDACAKLKPGSLISANVGFLVGGYSTGAGLGESWAVDIKQGKPLPARQLRAPDQPGISWGGMSEVLQRMILGYSPQLFTVLAEVSVPQGDKKVTPKELFDQLNPLLMAKLQAPVVFAPMPIQDAIDLGRFLVHSAVMYARFIPGAQVVGGPIELAAITKHEGFKWISRKHYYEPSLNREPQHVVLD